ncbi:MAG: Biotin-protein ligase [candidate division TM6 bacterium GW2011_GWF2_28_16]|jgi:BirA family biotin operon repressor/biotin-[acetyl-CoA-carboxylase] ligase|nr:MAG: Biotin-protein ligase [candidate division TM6 bacterium GW2011_GWF2_28_16]
MIPSKIFFKPEIYNSIDWAKENINNAPDGSVFMADAHKFTRGRQNRSWLFDKGQLVITLLLKPNILNILNILKNEDLGLRLNNLNMAISLAILENLEKFNIKLKWPNDFNYDNFKVAGILSQAIWQDNKISGIIFGFAINTNNLIKNNNLNFNAISLREISGDIINKENLFKEILVSCDRYYKIWLNLEFENIFNIWKEKLNYLINKNILIHKFDGEKITGKFIGVLENGDIVLEFENKIQEAISFNIVENILVKK